MSGCGAKDVCFDKRLQCPGVIASKLMVHVTHISSRLPTRAVQTLPHTAGQPHSTLFTGSKRVAEKLAKDFHGRVGFSLMPIVYWIFMGVFSSACLTAVKQHTC
jgi:hypothetical protein